jgi:hypothetical protein
MTVPAPEPGERDAWKHESDEEALGRVAEDWAKGRRGGRRRRHKTKPAAGGGAEDGEYDGGDPPPDEFVLIAPASAQVRATAAVFSTTAQPPCSLRCGAPRCSLGTASAARSSTAGGCRRG